MIGHVWFRVRVEIEQNNAIKKNPPNGWRRTLCKRNVARRFRNGILGATLAKMRPSIRRYEKQTSPMYTLKIYSTKFLKCSTSARRKKYPNLNQCNYLVIPHT